MTRLSFLLAVGFCFALSTDSVLAGVEDDMNEAEFRAAGLHKLTSAELVALNRWLDQTATPSTSNAAELSSTTAPARAAAQAPAESPPAPIQPTISRTPQSPVKEVTEFGQEQLEVPVAAEVPTAITARLKGEFRGWDGNTIFRLDNGQVWQQRVGGKYRSSKLMDPEVEVEKGRFGYYLKVLSSGRSVGVKRIR